MFEFHQYSVQKYFNSFYEANNSIKIFHPAEVRGFFFVITICSLLRVVDTQTALTRKLSAFLCYEIQKNNISRYFFDDQDIDLDACSYLMITSISISIDSKTGD